MVIDAGTKIEMYEQQPHGDTPQRWSIVLPTGNRCINPAINADKYIALSGPLFVDFLELSRRFLSVSGNKHGRRILDARNDGRQK